MSADTDDTDRPVNPPKQPPVVPIESPALSRPAQPSDPRRHASDTGSVASHSLEAFHDPAGAVGRGGFTFGRQSALDVPHVPHDPHAADELHKRRAR